LEHLIYEGKQNFRSFDGFFLNFTTTGSAKTAGQKIFVPARRQLLNMKAIIPVAGAGTKLRPHTYTQPKALIPLAGKTILSIIVDQLLEGGITEFIFIVGYLGTKIQDYVKDKYPHLKTSFVFDHIIFAPKNPDFWTFRMMCRLGGDFVDGMVAR
jgi:hypothetical protein